jgi:GNAT superfamily N-acetyltransferase
MQKQLQDALVLRSLSEGVQSDYDNIAQFYFDVFLAEGDDDTEIIGPWVEDLISGQHPYMSLDDVWVVVDTAKDDKIVSALLLIPQTWRYDHIDIPTGRVELVATDKDYRRRGLVRALMDVAHDRSKELGHLLQGITGIQHYYRRFGYAMAVNLGAGSQLQLTAVPKLKDDESEPFTLRKATVDDVPQIMAWEAYEQRDGGLAAKRDAEMWRYEIETRSDFTPVSLNIYIIVSEEGQDVGFVTFVIDPYYSSTNVWHYIIGEDSSYFATYSSVLRGIKQQIDDFYENNQNDKYKPAIRIRFESGVSSAIETLIRTTSDGRVRQHIYTWYLRVDDFPAFIKHIAPVLEERLVGSGMNRFTGELKVSFYQLNGVVITFEDGKITDVKMAEMAQYDGDAAFPYDTFLNVVFGHRTPRELFDILPEVYANPKAALLFDAIFPKMRSQIGDGIG